MGLWKKQFICALLKCDFVILSITGVFLLCRTKSSWATHQHGRNPPAWWLRASDPRLSTSSMCGLAPLLATLLTAPTLSLLLQLRVRLQRRRGTEELWLSLCFYCVLGRKSHWYSVSLIHVEIPAEMEFSFNTMHRRRREFSFLMWSHLCWSTAL